MVSHCSPNCPRTPSDPPASASRGLGCGHAPPRSQDSSNRLAKSFPAFSYIVLWSSATEEEKSGVSSGGHGGDAAVPALRSPWPRALPRRASPRRTLLLAREGASAALQDRTRSRRAGLGSEAGAAPPFLGAWSRTPCAELHCTTLGRPKLGSCGERTGSGRQRLRGDPQRRPLRGSADAESACPAEGSSPAPRGRLECFLATLSRSSLGVGGIETGSCCVAHPGLASLLAQPLECWDCRRGPLCRFVFWF